MKCPKCGEENQEGAKFCKSCGKNLQSGSSTESSIFESKGSNKTLIICATVIICVVIIAGAFLAFNSNSSSSTDADSTAEDSIDSADDVNADSAESADKGNRYENFSETEWDQSSYTIDEVYTAHTPEDAKIKMFNQADANGDGKLTGDEIKEMDYLLKHSEYTWNGPGIYIHEGYISTGSAKSDKTYCYVDVGEGYAGESVKISVLYSRDGKNLNDGNIIPKTVDSDGYVSVPSAKAFSKYPDEAFITIYDSDGNVLDTKTVYLDEKSGNQYF